MTHQSDAELIAAAKSARANVRYLFDKWDALASRAAAGDVAACHELESFINKVWREMNRHLEQGDDVSLAAIFVTPRSSMVN